MTAIQKQLLRFGLIGCIAFLVHWMTVVVIVETFSLQPLLANIVGFLCAFSVSYQGHSNWTFKTMQQPRFKTLPRFALVALLGFGLNETLYFLFFTVGQLNYRLGLTMALIITSVSTFVLSKIWAFKNASERHDPDLNLLP